MSNLPLPSLEAKLHSQALEAHIQTACLQAGGQIPFKQFMNLALYAPGLGYYSAGSCKLGAEGDFITAPEISPLFGQSLSFALQSILKDFSGDARPCILELGAGTGKLAGDILENLDILPEKYFILEVSADLIERQKQYLSTRLSSALFERIEWLNALPKTPFAGIIIANEVIDAMPIHRVNIATQQEYYVGYNNQFEWILDKPSTSQLNHLLANFSVPSENYISEINTDLEPWLKGLAASLTQGVMIFIDYGFPEHEYYHPDRKMGTLMCHYRHHNHDDVFQYIGLTDITAHVDFTALANAAQAAGLSVAGFTTQGNYLLDNNLLTYAECSYLISQQIQKLTHPQEMGELFKVMAFTKEWEHALTGFRLRDHRGRL